MARQRRWWFYPALALLVPASMEIISMLAYQILEGRRFSYATIRDEQYQRREESPSLPNQRESSPRPHRFLAETAIHPYLGYVGNPVVDAGFTDLGFWGDAVFPPLRRSPDRLLVGIYGGSVAGELLKYGGKTLHSRLQQSGRWPDREVVLLNMTLGGYKQPQQLMALTWMLSLGAEFDVIVNLDGFNEVALDASENALQGVFPGYPRTWAFRVDRFADPEFVERAGKVVFLRERQTALAERFAAFPWRASVTGGLVWTLLDRLEAGKLAEARLELLEYRPPERPFGATGPPRPDTDAEVYRLLADTWMNSSVQMDRTCRANGIRYYHFLQPNQYLEGSKPLSQEERRIAFAEDHPYRPGVRVGYPLLRQRGRMLASQGIAFHDLTHIFARVEETIYADDCCHANPRGYELLAEAVASAILER